MSDSDGPPGDKPMPLMDHLIELRQRLIYSILGFIVAFGVCMFFAADIFDFLMRPLSAVWEGQDGRRLIYTHMAEQFLTQVKVAFFAAAFCSFPIVATQLWMFIAPGLYANEKGAFLPFLIATPVLFFTGGALLYYGVLPLAWQFFAGFEQPAQDGSLPIVLEPKVNEYLSLVMQLIFAFGLAFQLPVLLVLLTRSGLVEIATLRRQRRYAIVIAFVVAAVLTPPDPISQISLAIPLIALYEISIIVASLWQRKRDRDMANAEKELELNT